MVNKFYMVMFLLYGHLAVAMVHEKKPEADGFIWWVQSSALEKPVGKSFGGVPEFEYFSQDDERFFQQLGSERKKSRYSFAHKQLSDEISYRPMELKDALIALNNKPLGKKQSCSIYAIPKILLQQEGKKSENTCDALWDPPQSMNGFIKRCMYENRFFSAIKAVCFMLNTVPSCTFLKRLHSVATDDGPYQLVKVTAPHVDPLRSGIKRDLERQAQRLGYSFYSRHHFEWRRLSKALFQIKVCKHSPGAHKGSIS